MRDSAHCGFLELTFCFLLRYVDFWRGNVSFLYSKHYLKWCLIYRLDCATISLWPFVDRVSLFWKRASAWVFWSTFGKLQLKILSKIFISDTQLNWHFWYLPTKLNIGTALMKSWETCFSHKVFLVWVKITVPFFLSHLSSIFIYKA